MLVGAHAPQRVDRIFGRQILPAQLVRKGRETAINFVVGHGDVEIFERDWEKAVVNFPIAEAKVEQDAEGIIHFMNQGKSELLIKCDRAEVLLSFFQPKERREPETGGSQFKPDVEKMLCFATRTNPQEDAEVRGEFRRLAEAQARRRMLFLSCRQETSDLLIMCICSEFKMRFPQVEPDNWAEAFEVLFLEFIGSMVALWAQCFSSIIAPHSGPNSREYFRRLAASASALIARGAEQFRVDWTAFLAATRVFLETGACEELPVRLRELITRVESALGQVRRRWILQLVDWFEYAQVFSAAVHIALAVLTKTDCKETRVLTDALSSWSVSLMDNRIKVTRHNDLRSAVDRLAVEVLKDVDRERYNQDFHCMLALWKLAELVKSD